MRYIDADELYRETEKKIKANNEYGMAVVDDEFLDLINDAFTEDVVPRSEVAILTAQNMALEYAKYGLQHELNIYKGVEKILDKNMAKMITTAIDGAKREVAREIFEEIESVLSYSVYPQIRADGTIKTIKSNDFHIRAEDYNTIKKKYTEEEI